MRPVTVKLTSKLSLNKPPNDRQKSRRCEGVTFTINSLESTLILPGLNDKKTVDNVSYVKKLNFYQSLTSNVKF